MTLLQKIQNLIWFNNVAKLKEILVQLSTTTDSIDDRLTIVESTPSSAPSYKVYSALLTQTGTNNPTAIILESTLGQNIIWTYSDVGQYICTFSDNMPADKIGLIIGTNDINSTLLTFAADYASQNCYILSEKENKASSPYVFQYSNSLLNNTLVEIRIYN